MLYTNGMTTAEQIIAIILCSFLGIFLILSIAVMVAVLKLVNNLRHITAKAERVVDSAETVGEMFRKSAAPLGFLHFVRSVAETAAQHKTRKGDKHE